jgi:arylsulfatase A-like enzyme
MSTQREKSIRFLKPVVLIGGAAVLLFVVAVLIRMERRHVRSVREPPVILISVASLNTDEAVSRKSMPYLAELVSRSLVFMHASTCVPDPLASVTSLLTGCYPEANRLGFKAGAKLSPKVRTLAERFRAKGYATAAFLGQDVLSIGTDLARGFDRCDTFGPSFSNRQRGVGKYGATAIETVTRALAWLDQHKGQRCFLMLYLNDLAADQPISTDKAPPALVKYLMQVQKRLKPGVPPSRRAILELLAPHLTAADVNALRALYMRAVTDTDQALARFFAALRKNGMFENATILLCGDRGEPLADRSMHPDTSLYQDCVSIPLMMKFGNNRRLVGRSPVLVQNVDVAPTLIEACGLAADSPPQGVSLLSLTRQSEPPRTSAYYVSKQSQRAFRQGAHKILVDGKQVRLFDLSIDPEERQDLLTNPIHPKLFPKTYAKTPQEKEQLLLLMRNLKNVKDHLQLELMRFSRAVSSASMAGAGADLRVADRGSESAPMAETR